MDRYLIAGLGNPGEKYINTRHNVGFEMLDTLASYNNITVNKIKCKALIGEGKIGETPVVLAKPQTYMNLSGESVLELCNYFKIAPQNTIIMFDDVSLETGKIRIRQRGSAGGHNGMKNIIYHLQTDEIPRVRFGIGQPEFDLADYVLSEFNKDEVKLMIESAKCVPDIIELILNNKISMAMSKYN
ncbi:MAG: aminoacyl-tRNA hydrolase [Clostridia bacterium]|nr:aminoacyl-tRNA hydrolase [Clostridia bacterium]